MTMAWYDNAVFYHIYPLGLCSCAHENDGQPTPGAFEKLNAWAEHAAQIDKALRGIVLYNLAKLTVLEHILRSKHRIAVEQQVIFRAAHGRFYLIHIISSEMERD